MRHNKALDQISRFVTGFANAKPAPIPPSHGDSGLHLAGQLIVMFLLDAFVIRE